MQAARVHEPGPPDVIIVESIDVPEPGKQEVLVRVHTHALRLLAPHAMHHASCGHLERRGLGDVEILTVREYMALFFWGRLRYRVYRHPSVMFGIGPAYLFILKHRLPVGLLRDGWQPGSAPWQRISRSR